MARTRRLPAVRTRLSRLGFYYGWVVVAACFLCSAVGFGVIYSFSVFFGHIATEFGQSAASTSFIFSLQSVVTFGTAAVVGVLVDRFGVRRLLALGTVLVGGGLYGASQLETLLGVLVAYGVVAAAGLAIVITVAFATTPQWFGRRRGLSTGIATSGTGIGILLAPPFAALLIEASGWRAAYLGFTVVAVALLGLATLVLADGPPDLGVDTSDEFGAEDPPSGSDEPLREQLGDLREIVTTLPFAVLFVGVLFAYTPPFLVLVFVVEHATDAGLGQGTGILAVSLVGAMNIVGKNLAGPASDRFGMALLVAACSGLMGVTTGLLSVAPSSLAVVGLAVLFGVGYGGVGALVAPLIADLFGTGNLYSLFGLTSIAFAIGGSVVPYLAGVGRDTFGTFVPVFAVGGVAGLLAAALFVVSARLTAADTT